MSSTKLVCFFLFLLLLQLSSFSLAKETHTSNKTLNSTNNLGKVFSHLKNNDTNESIVDVLDEEEPVSTTTKSNSLVTAKSVGLQDDQNFDHTSSSSSSHCEPTRNLPVLGNIARGVDIRTLDLQPTVLTNRNGFSRVIFNFTCSPLLMMESPLVKGEKFAKPEGVDSVEAKPKPTVVTTRLYRNLSTFRTENSRAVRLPASSPGSDQVGRFVFSAGYDRLKSRLRESTQFLAETHSALHRYVVRLNAAEQLPLTAQFSADLARLSPDFTHNWPLYEYFLDYYGTHYWAVASVGEVVSMRTTVRKEYLNYGLMADQTLTTLIEADFTRTVQRRLSGDVQAKVAEVRKGVANQEESFAKNVQTKFFWYGGGWRLGEPGLIFGGRLEGLHTLVKDPLLRSALQRAILIRGAQASLVDLEDTLSGGDEEEEEGKEEVVEEKSGSCSKSIYILDEEKKTLQELDDYFSVITASGRYSYDEQTLAKMVEKLTRLTEKVEAKAGV